MTKEILDNMNQTELAQAGLQETKDKRIIFNWCEELIPIQY